MYMYKGVDGGGGLGGFSPLFEQYCTVYMGLLKLDEILVVMIVG